MNSRSNTISNCENELIAAGASGLKDYMVRLLQNSGTPNFVDFLWEAEVALTLLDHGFSVTLRDAPDLEVKSGAEVFYVEVTHFRRRAQDAVDEAAMQAPDDGYL